MFHHDTNWFSAIFIAFCGLFLFWEQKTVGHSNIENRFEKVLTLRDVQNIDFPGEKKQDLSYKRWEEKEFLFCLLMCLKIIQNL